MTIIHPPIPSESSVPSVDEIRLRLEAPSTVDAQGDFIILAISAGRGNGWDFPAAALRASLPLWQGVQTFVDHAGAAARGARSLRDLGGVCHSPAWDEARQGITLQLRTLGPSGPLVRALGREVLAGGEPRPSVGFSADLLFAPAATGGARAVARILRVLSLDLVFDPARGGAFLRALNSVGKEAEMDDPTIETSRQEAEGSRQETEGRRQEAVGSWQGGGGSRQETGGSRQGSRGAGERPHTEAAHYPDLADYLLETALAASRLPAQSQEYLRRQFGGRAFTPAELNAAINHHRALAAALSAPGVVQGPGRVEGVFDTRDRLQAAVDDLFQAPRASHLRNLQVPKLTGIRELYHTLTGDFDFHGGVYPERLALQHTTASFAGLVKNAMNKAIVERWEQLGRAGYGWWQKVAHVEHFDTLNQVSWVITGSVGALPAVSEGAEYTELKLGDSPETSDFVKYGGYIGLTLETLDRDDMRRLRAVPRELANAAIRRISSLVAAIFTANAGAGPTLADGGALFNNTAVTTAGGHANLRTTALSAAEWEVVQTAVYNQPLLVANESGYYGAGARLALNPRFLLVPRALELTARKIIYPTLENAANIYSENQQRGAPGDVVVVPEWTDATDWAAAADPALVPGICIGERFGLLPEVFVAGDELSPAVFMNDESRIKVRHFVAVGVADFRPLHKSNVAG